MVHLGFREEEEVIGREGKARSNFWGGKGFREQPWENRHRGGASACV